MFTTGHAIGLRERSSSNQLLLEDPVPELDDEEGEISARILYKASFEELAGSHVQYDTVIWVLISLLLVLAWGFGIIMLLYLPVRRYVLRKDISSRKLYVTPNEIVYKVARPSFLPFWGVTKIEKHIPLALVIDIITEQGCLQSMYGIHTFRVESIPHGKAASVDELQVQGVSNPGVLRKVIVEEASKMILGFGTSWKPVAYTGEGEGTRTPSRMGSVSEAPAMGKSPSKIRKEPRGVVPGDVLLNKLEEVKQSVQRLESLVENSQSLLESD
ncbi:uncharacterized protein LOC122661886 [Telopea speciosissima]|uniref:uncharacterized protein LOC122661886 n=1 Tax=Telopea speciosissima TaxID=54955 RepID=UPI001CC771B5|nr:uncharacterized protein LOC122661886 [Telopea speciosissima]XP_043713334.1 uncharacterized protein LOC122661886 [Telopea speciosissima]XP_043713335.1 uncharacterized protein LOC122661886 [Telopea speciosissima]